MSKPKSTYSGAVLRAAAAERLAAQDPAAQARRHEASFLRSMAQAKDDFDWILTNQAWTQLGFPTFADWWDARVAPLGASLGMRPTREIAKTVIEKVVEEQKALPKAQQRSQREIAAMVGVDRSTVARSTPGANARGTDLETADADPVDAMHAALEDIDAHLAGQRTEDHTNKDGGRPAPVPSRALPERPGVTSGSAPAEQVESRDGSPPVAERPQEESGVSTPAAAHQPAEDEQAKTHRELRERSSQRFCEGIAALTTGIGRRGPEAWLEQVYLPGAYKVGDMPGVAKCFTPESLRELARTIYTLADHLQETGQELP